MKYYNPFYCWRDGIDGQKKIDEIVEVIKREFPNIKITDDTLKLFEFIFAKSYDKGYDDCVESTDFGDI